MKNNYKEIVETKYLNSLLKITSINERIILGRLKCADNLGNLFLTECVEVFDKEADYYTNFNLFKNTDEHLFSFESKANQSQIYSPTIVPKNQIKSIKLLKC